MARGGGCAGKTAEGGGGDGELPGADDMGYSDEEREDDGKEGGAVSHVKLSGTNVWMLHAGGAEVSDGRGWEVADDARAME